MDGITLKAYYSVPAYVDYVREHKSLCFVLSIPVYRTGESDDGETISIFWNIGSAWMRDVICSRVWGRNEETSWLERMMRGRRL